MIPPYLASKAACAILDLLLSNPTAEFYEAELGKKARISKASASNWLSVFVKEGIFLKRVHGRMKLYKLNRENIVVKQLKVAITVADLNAKMLQLKTSANVYLFGSVARGEDDEKSDVDILVIGKDRSEASRLKTGPKMRISFFTPLEWVQMSKKDPAFFERIEKDKIKLI